MSDGGGRAGCGERDGNGRVDASSELLISTSNSFSREFIQHFYRHDLYLRIPGGFPPRLSFRSPFHRCETVG